VRLYYRETLEKAAFATDEAINGIEAMEKVLARPFWERWRSCRPSDVGASAVPPSRWRDAGRGRRPFKKWNRHLEGRSPLC
jgi:hypothetical protein